MPPGRDGRFDPPPALLPGGAKRLDVSDALGVGFSDAVVLGPADFAAPGLPLASQGLPFDGGLPLPPGPPGALPDFSKGFLPGLEYFASVFGAGCAAPDLRGADFAAGLGSVATGVGCAGATLAGLLEGAASAGFVA